MGDCKQHSRSAGDAKVIMTFSQPPEKQDAQVMDNQCNGRVLFLESLLPVGRGWRANKSLQPTAVGRFVEKGAGRFAAVTRRRRGTSAAVGEF
jgi:hypothetical protein